MEETINQRVKKARILLNMSQEEIAEAIEKKVPAISKIESGSQSVTPELIAFYNRKGISPDWLLSGEGEMRKEAGTNFSDNKIKGNANVQGYGNTSPARDEECRQELAKAKEEVEMWRNKYITLLEKGYKA